MYATMPKSSAEKYNNAENNSESTDDHEHLSFPLDIVLQDLIWGGQKSAEFFEVSLNNQGEFESDKVLLRQGLTPASQSVIDESRSFSLGSECAFVIFIDRKNKVRMFVNCEYEHTAIQPGMGMPVFAGRIKKNNDMYEITNESGHYKPKKNIDLMALLKEHNPSASLEQISYKEVDFDNEVTEKTVRVPEINSPEEFRCKTQGNDDEFYCFLSKHYGRYMDNQPFFNEKMDSIFDKRMDSALAESGLNNTYITCYSEMDLLQQIQYRLEREIQDLTKTITSTPSNKNRLSSELNGKNRELAEIKRKIRFMKMVPPKPNLLPPRVMATASHKRSISRLFLMCSGRRN